MGGRKKKIYCSSTRRIGLGPDAGTRLMITLVFFGTRKESSVYSIVTPDATTHTHTDRHTHTRFRND